MSRKYVPSSKMETPRDHGELEVYKDIREGCKDTPA